MSKRDKYTTLELENLDETQKLIVEVVMHEGELREQDKILALMSEHQPPAEYAEGYQYAVEILTKYIYGSNDEEKD